MSLPIQHQILFEAAKTRGLILEAVCMIIYYILGCSGVILVSMGSLFYGFVVAIFGIFVYMLWLWVCYINRQKQREFLEKYSIKKPIKKTNK